VNLNCRRRRIVYRIRDFERKIAALQKTVAEIEAELSGLVLFVSPVSSRKNNTHFAGGDLSRACLDVLRGETRMWYTHEIALAVLGAKGLSTADKTLWREACKPVTDSLGRMERRGIVVKAGYRRQARWGLPGAVRH
jgi:hypothetical protein